MMKKMRNTVLASAAGDRLRWKPVACSVRMLLLMGTLSSFMTPELHAEEWFNPALLSGAGMDGPSVGVADLSRYEAGEQAAGTYRVSIYLNNDYVDTRDVVFEAGDNNAHLQPVFTREEYTDMGVRPQAFDALPGDGPVKNLSAAIPAATTVFHFSEQRLDISVPQMMMAPRARGAVDPRLWDHGIPALLLDYMLTGSESRNRSGEGETSRSLYGNFRGGINLGDWRLRSYATYSRQEYGRNTSSDFQVISTYLRRDVTRLHGELVMGDSSSPSDVFDSVSFRGVQLASDETMLPDSQRGFAPVIRGVAQSGGQVTIRQNGNVIYQAHVPPGPFEITDLYPTSFSGDLKVTVKEDNGSEHSFAQAYSSVAVMQREGQIKYALTAGRLRGGNSDTMREPVFVQGTLIYGLPHDVTVYGGGQVAEKYQAVSAGAGMGLGALGALSVDVTQADATLPDGQKSQGQSYRVRYSKSMVDTGTSVSLAAYRYSTRGYYSLSDASSSEHDTDNDFSSYRPRSELQVNISQELGGYGSLYVSGSQRDFWQREGTDRTWSLGYNTSVKGISLGLNASQSRNSNTQHEDRRLSMNISVPLGRWLPGNDALYQANNMQLNYGVTTNESHQTSHMAGLSGSALEGGQLSYSLNTSTTNQGQGSSLGLSSTYQGSAGEVSAGYSRTQNQTQLSAGLRGGVLIHPWGVTLSQPLGETVALVRAPGASGLTVNNQTGLTTDWRGYAVVPYLSPYKRTDVTLDPAGMGDDVAMNMTSKTVVPTRGAVVLADYPTQRGAQVLMTLMKSDNTPVPFGAMVTRSTGPEEDAAIVGDGGQVFLTGMPGKGTLDVKWGSGSNQTCRVPFRLPDVPAKKDSGPLQLNGVCHQK